MAGCPEWRPHVCGRLNAHNGRLNAVFLRPVRAIARRGAIYDARCRNGTSGRPRCASACVACTEVSRGITAGIRGIATVVRASQVAPLRLRAVQIGVYGGHPRHRGGRPGVRGGVPMFAGGADRRVRRASAASRQMAGRPGWRPHVCGRLNAHNGRLNAVFLRPVCAIA